MKFERYTQDQLDWLRSGYRAWRVPELTERFNAVFGADRTQEKIKSCLQNHRMPSGRKRGFAKGERPRSWTPDKLAWLREHRASGEIGEITKRLNDRFGWNATQIMVANACSRHGISAATSGRYGKRNRPWNLGMKGYSAGGDRTRFAAGHRPHTEMPVGAYKQDAEGYWYCKVSDAEVFPNAHKNWAAVHRLTWEGIHGPIPRGHVVVLLDGDQGNCLDAENLACISRRVFVYLNSLNWTALCPDRDARRAAIAMASLRVAICTKAKAAGLSLHHRRALITPLEKLA
jgi:hypothetical protein